MQLVFRQSDVTLNGVPVTCGKVKLFYAADADGNPTNYANKVGDWVNFTGGGVRMDENDKFEVVMTGVQSCVGIRAFWQSTGKDCGVLNLVGSHALFTDICVGGPASECGDDLSITARGVSASAEDNLYTFKTQWVVKACKDFTNLKTQGGLTAGSTSVVPTVPSTSDIKYTKQNTIFNWQVPVVNSGEVFTYNATFTKTIKSGPCAIHDITGAWSAKAWSPVTVDDVTTLVETVAGYYNKIYYDPCAQDFSN